MITTRNDLTTAKQMLDNLDQVNAAIASLGPGGTITITITQHLVVVNVSDALAFLQTLQTNLSASLKNMGVAV